MKQVIFIFIFSLLSSSSWAGGFQVTCPLSAPAKLSLIKASPYYVDDIHCVKNNKTYEWYISNKRFLLPVSKFNLKAKKSKHSIAQKQRIIRKSFVTSKAPNKAIKRTIASEPQENSPSKEPNSNFTYDKWKIGINYGVKYFSYEQSKDLGKAELAITLPEYYKVYSQYRYGDWEFLFDYERYTLKYESGSNSGEESLNEFILKSSYKNFLLGIAMIDSPIFKNEAGVISMSKLSVTHAVLGYKMAWQLPVKKETHLEFNPTIYYPVSVSSGSTDIVPSSPSGYMIDFEAKLSRTIKQTDTYKIRAVWPTNARYQSLSNNIEWGNSTGSIESNMWSVGTQLGIEINF